MKVILWFIQANINPNKDRRSEKKVLTRGKVNACGLYKFIRAILCKTTGSINEKCVTCPLVVLPSNDGNGLVLTAILACSDARCVMLRTNVPVSRNLFQLIFLSHHFWVNTHLRQRKGISIRKKSG